MRRRLTHCLAVLAVSGLLTLSAKGCAGPEREASSDDCYPQLEITRYEPQWPDGTREAGVEGEVHLGVRLGDDGQLDEIEILNAEPEGVFEQAVKDAVRQWTFDWYWDAEPCAYHFEQTIVFES